MAYKSVDARHLGAINLLVIAAAMGPEALPSDFLRMIRDADESGELMRFLKSLPDVLDRCVDESRDRHTPALPD